MDETTAINLIGGFTAIGILWRLVLYQGQQILKLTKRQDIMWEKCFEQYVDTDNIKE